MLAYPLLQKFLWVLGMTSEVVLAALIIHSRLLPRFRFFFLFVMAHIVSSFAGALAYFCCSVAVYGMVYWIFLLPAELLMFLFVLELYQEAFQPYGGFRKLFQTVLGWITVSFAVVIAAYVWLAGIQADPMQWINRWMYQIQGAISFSQALLLVVLLAFVASFQIRVSSTVAWLAATWLMNVALQMIFSGFRVRFGLPADRILNVVGPFSYALVIGVSIAVVVRASARVTIYRPLFFNPSNSEALLGRLESLNGVLSKALRG